MFSDFNVMRNMIMNLADSFQNRKNEKFNNKWRKKNAKLENF